MPRIAIAEDARLPLRTLLVAVALTLALWFVPYVEWLIYPFRLFVTFIHEGGHALMTLLTSNSVQSLTVHSDGSGEVMSLYRGFLPGLLISSAGYIGATLYGSLLLFLIRRAVAARIVLASTAAFILLMTLAFGWHDIFTFASGLGLGLALIGAAKWAPPRAATFLMSFLAIQCVLNALFDLRTLFHLSSPFGVPVHTDAANMAADTGIPAVVWATLWIGVSLFLLFVALRSYLTVPKTAKDATPVAAV